MVLHTCVLKVIIYSYVLMILFNVLLTVCPFLCFCYGVIISFKKSSPNKNYAYVFILDKKLSHSKYDSEQPFNS